MTKGRNILEYESIEEKEFPEGASALPQEETANDRRTPSVSFQGMTYLVPSPGFRTSTPIPHGSSHTTRHMGTIHKTTFPITSYSSLMSSQVHTSRAGGPRKEDHLQ